MTGRYYFVGNGQKDGQDVSVCEICFGAARGTGARGAVALVDRVWSRVISTACPSGHDQAARGSGAINTHRYGGAAMTLRCARCLEAFTSARESRPVCAFAALRPSRPGRRQIIADHRFGAAVERCIEREWPGSRRWLACRPRPARGAPQAAANSAGRRPRPTSGPGLGHPDQPVHPGAGRGMAAWAVTRASGRSQLPQIRAGRGRRPWPTRKTRETDRR